MKKALKPLNFKAFLLAQKEGFEPSRAFYTPTPLAGEPLRPLGYFCKPKMPRYALPEYITIAQQACQVRI